MSDRDRDQEDGQSGHLGDEAALQARLRTLEAKLAGRRAAVEQDRKRGARASDGQGMAQGLKVASEFVAGVMVGAGLGWLFDQWLGTSPFGLIVLMLFGFAAGVLNVLRAVGVTSEPEDRLRRDGKE